MIPTNTPDALRLAGAIEQQAKRIRESAKILGLAEIADDDMVLERASEELRRLHAEVERLNSCLQWEQNRANRMGTHGEDCWKWGPAHYECALREVEKLRQAQGGEAVAIISVGREHMCRDAEVHAKSIRYVDGLLAECIEQEMLRPRHGSDVDAPLHWRLRGGREKLRLAIESLERGYAVSNTSPSLQADACNVPQKLWLWKNFVEGKPEYWAFDNPFPVHMDYGDPQTLGEPCGYALFKPSRQGRTDVSEADVLRAMLSASQAAPTQVETQRRSIEEKRDLLNDEYRTGLDSPPE